MEHFALKHYEYDGHLLTLCIQCTCRCIQKTVWQPKHSTKMRQTWGTDSGSSQEKRGTCRHLNKSNGAFNGSSHNQTLTQTGPFYLNLHADGTNRYYTTLVWLMKNQGPCNSTNFLACRTTKRALPTKLLLVEENWPLEWACFFSLHFCYQWCLGSLPLLFLLLNWPYYIVGCELARLHKLLRLVLKC